MRLALLCNKKQKRPSPTSAIFGGEVTVHGMTSRWQALFIDLNVQADSQSDNGKALSKKNISQFNAAQNRHIPVVEPARVHALDVLSFMQLRL